MKKLALLALGVGAAFAASAQGTVGTVQDVKGSITVASQKAVKRATSGMAVADGASILVASDGAGTLVLNNGCVVALKGSQHVTVNAALKCTEQQASVKDLFQAYKVAQAPVGGGLVAPGATAGAAGAGSAGFAAASGGMVAGAAVGTLAAVGAVAAVSVAAVVANESEPTPISGQ